MKENTCSTYSDFTGGGLKKYENILLFRDKLFSSLVLKF